MQDGVDVVLCTDSGACLVLRNSFHNGLMEKNHHEETTKYKDKGTLRLRKEKCALASGHNDDGLSEQQSNAPTRSDLSGAPKILY